MLDVLFFNIIPFLNESGCRYEIDLDCGTHVYLLLMDVKTPLQLIIMMNNFDMVVVISNQDVHS